MKLLHLDSSILGAQSGSRSLSAAAVGKFKSLYPGLQVVYRDLAEQPLSHLSGGYLAAASGAPGEPSPSLKSDLAQGETVMKEFLEADIVVIGVAFYNFTVSSQLKAWIDRILVAGKTFRYGEKGPEGLVGHKRVVLAISRGGFYGPGSPAQPYEHAETYLRAVFGFIGVHHPEVVSAEGMNVGPEQREQSVKAALGRIDELAVAA